MKNLKHQAIRSRNFEEKIVLLIVADEHKAFRREFGIPLTAFNHEAKEVQDDWFEALFENREKHSRYLIRLQELANQFGFEKTEIPSIEDFLQTGDPIVLTRDAEPTEKEKETFRPTRSWDTVSVVKRVALMRRKEMKYKEIAEHFNETLESIGIKRKVTVGSLKTLMSRADDKLDGKLEDLKVNL